MHVRRADRDPPEVLGHDVVTDSRAVRQRVGYVFGRDHGLYDRSAVLL